jgi:ribosomal-protein-alanine N-acetyltransferase
VEIVIMLAFTILHMSVELRTKRPLQLADAEPTQRLFPRWEIVKFLNSKVSWPYPADRVLNVYRNESSQASSAEKNGTGLFRLKEAPNNALV